MVKVTAWFHMVTAWFHMVTAWFHMVMAWFHTFSDGRDGSGNLLADFLRLDMIFLKMVKLKKCEIECSV